MTQFTPDQATFVDSRRVGRLATCDPDGQPHVVPICYAFDGERLFSPLDEKPKRVEVARLKRVRNILANPRVSIVVDDYSDDWSELAYLLVLGRAELVESGPQHDEALRLLREKYPQYRSMALEERPVLMITPDRVVSWRY